MALFLSQLILFPILAVFTWMYVRLRPQGAPPRSMLWFDLLTIGMAVALSLLGFYWSTNIEIGDASPIWIPILSIITTFHIYPLILFFGWLVRRHIYSSYA